MKDSVRRFYEEVARSDISERPEVAWARPRLSGPRVLDIGCGDGALTSQVVRASAPVTVGVDLSATALSAARHRRLTVVQAGFDRVGLPFANASFDTVLMHQVIEHVVDTDGLVSEARRVLVPGGMLLLSTPNLAAWFNRGLLALGVQPVFSEVSMQGVFGRPGRELAGHLRLFTRRALQGFLTAHGFVDLEFTGATYHDVPRSLRWLDRILARWPSAAAQLLVQASAPGSATS